MQEAEVQWKVSSRMRARIEELQRCLLSSRSDFEEAQVQIMICFSERMMPHPTHTHTHAINYATPFPATF